MLFSKLVVPSVFLQILFLCMVVFSLAQQVPKPQKGRVQKNVYYCPANNFSVPVPKGFKISDAHMKGYGGVSFHDDFGRLHAIHYATRQSDMPTEILENGGTHKLLLKWLHDFAMSTWFKPTAPDSRVLAESVGTFEGMPAVFALIDAPGAHALERVTIRDGKQVRARVDSRRVVAVFQKGHYLYMLASETVIFSLFGDKGPAEPEEDWLHNLEDSKPFFRSISFRE